MNAQSHMHARGVGYVANLLDASGAKMQELYTTTTWQHVVTSGWTRRCTISAGQDRLPLQLHEQRDPRDRQGRTTRDEMCMFIGLYYPRDTKPRSAA